MSVPAMHTHLHWRCMGDSPHANYVMGQVYYDCVGINMLPAALSEQFMLEDIIYVHA